MNRSVSKYRRRVRRALACGPLGRRKLMLHMDGMLVHFLADCPAPDQRALEDAFGPPEAVAAELMTRLSIRELRSARRWRLVRTGLCVLVFLLVLLFALFADYVKERTVLSVQDPATITAEQAGE